MRKPQTIICGLGLSQWYLKTKKPHRFGGKSIGNMADREDLARRLSTAVSVAISEALATQEQTQHIPVRTFFPCNQNMPLHWLFVRP